jgi:hypothetical protein
MSLQKWLIKSNTNESNSDSDLLESLLPDPNLESTPENVKSTQAPNIFLSSFCHHIINLSPVLFSQKTKKVYIIEHDRPRCHNVVVDLVCFSNDYQIIPID